MRKFYFYIEKFLGPASSSLTILKLLVTFSWLVFFTFSASPLRAADSRELAAVKERLHQAAATVSEVRARMRQEKHLQAFAETQVSQGSFSFRRPDCWSWELAEPAATGIAVCGESGERWQGKDGPRQSFKLSQQPWLRHFSEQITAWTTADFARLEKDYEISLIAAAPPVLRLVPRAAAAREHLTSMEISFSPDCRYLTRLCLNEAGGDFTVWEFYEVKVR